MEEKHESKEEYLDSSTEEVVEKMVLEELDMASVDSRTNLFNYGARSINIAVILANLKDQFGVQISLKEVYSEPTVRRIALKLQNEILSPGADSSRSPGAAADEIS